MCRATTEQCVESNLKQQLRLAIVSVGTSVYFVNSSRVLKVDTEIVFLDKNYLLISWIILITFDRKKIRYIKSKVNVHNLYTFVDIFNYNNIVQKLYTDNFLYSKDFKRSVQFPLYCQWQLSISKLKSIILFFLFSGQT